MMNEFTPSKPYEHDRRSQTIHINDLYTVYMLCVVRVVPLFSPAFTC